MASCDEALAQVSTETLDESVQHALQAFHQMLTLCTPKVRWLIVFDILHTLMGKNPEEVAVLDFNNNVYINIVSPRFSFDKAMCVELKQDKTSGEMVSLKQLLQLAGASGDDLDYFDEELKSIQPSQR